MNINLSPKDPCPCGSGTLLASCCLRGDRVVPSRAKVQRPGGTSTHPRDYARGLKGCSSKITLEHFISRSVLERLEPQGTVTVDGLADNPFRASIDGLGGKVLCSAHNNALDPLDRVGKAFFEDIADAPGRLRSNTGARRHVRLFNGHDLERWLMKVLLGFICTKGKDWEPPQPWLDFLFGISELPPDCGMFMSVANPAETKVAGGRIQAQVLNDKITGEPGGLTLQLEGYTFGLGARPGVFNVAVYRPQAIRLTHADRDAVHLLGWDSPLFNLTVEVVLQ